LLQDFFRRFGVLRESSTPCGKKLSISHAHALMILLDAERSLVDMGQQTLGTMLGLDKSTVARLCQKMILSEHIIQTIGTEDARSRLLTLTSRGRKLAQEVELASHDRFRKLLSAIPEDQCASVMTGLRVLYNSMNKL